MNGSSLLDMSGKDRKAKSKYEKWVRAFSIGEDDEVAECMNEIESDLITAQKVGYGSNLELISALESVLVCLLGHRMEDVRENAVVLLNVLYDGHDLQLRESLSVQIASADETKIELFIPVRDRIDETQSPLSESQVAKLCVKVFGPSKDLNSPPRWTNYPVDFKANAPVGVLCFIGEFPRSGFYDWTLSGVDSTGNSILETYFDHRRYRGRIIVQPSGIREDFFMEAPVEQVGAAWNDSTGQLEERGTFDSVLGLLPELKLRGITGLYLMGALEHSIGQEDNSPMSVADRARPDSLLGGPSGFSHLVTEMRRLGIKPIIDGLERVGTRAHRKYRKYGVQTRTEKGLMSMHSGTDARENQWSDTLLLNYRRVEVWDLMLRETKQMVREFGVKGIRLDNAQSYPVILAADLSELLRSDPDGELHYSLDEIFYGEVVLSNVEGGYWQTEACMDLNYPNPFLIKYMKEMWNEFPDFVVIGESNFHREVELAQSGVIPQSMQIPQILASISGKSLRRDGSVARVAQNRRSSARTLSRVLKNGRECMPKNSIVIQSTCSHTSPYPGALYGRRSWIAADLMYFLPGIPMLMFEEDGGRAVRLNMTGISNKEEESAYDVHYDALLPKSPKKRAERMPSSESSNAMSQLTLNSTGTPTTGGGMRRVASNLSMGGSLPRAESKGRLSRVPSSGKLSRKGSLQDMRKAAETGSAPGYGSPMVRSQSKDQLKSSAIRNTTAQDIFALNETNRRIYEEIGPGAGYDLAQIKGHYNHRELVRQEFDVFRAGGFCVLGADPQYREQLFAFARYSTSKILMMVMNIKDIQDGDAFREGINANVFLQPLAESLPMEFTHKMNSLFCLKDGFTGDRIDNQLYTLEEILFRRLRLYVPPLAPLLIEITEASGDSREEHLRQCVHRLSSEASDVKDPRENMITARLARGAAEGIDAFAIALMETYHALLESHLDQGAVEYLLQLALQRASGLYYGVLYEGLEPPKDFNPPKGERIIAFLLQLAMAAEDPDVKEAARLLVKKSQKIGPLVFVCPEYGRFSTAGGLGVMVDELTKDLAALGLEVYAITPYYTVNRKNQAGYLEHDKFKWTRNFKVNIGTGEVECGMFEGVEDGVNLIFIERGDFFPKVYADTYSAEKHLQTIVLMSLGSLEACCQKGIAPAVFVTNDWLPSLAAGYGKNGFFGNFFDNTTFFHLIHNLGEGAYEGRCYPSPEQGDMGYIHRLRPDFLVNPHWEQKLVNPSRCAIMCSDSWGTVSPSYLKELKGSHPLKDLLSRARAPFAFPNGIRQAHREELLRLKGAESHEEGKRILQQKYFGFQDLDDSIPLFAFVGRITAQKGVHLILNAVDELIRHTNGKIQILVGGPATWSDSYSAGCARHMQDLRRRHSYCFWADPDAFFTDGPLVNLGADFGVMPSVFEPGGIVQQEFFVAGTPVVAFKTGGLKDTVHEWNADIGEGNGFTFENYNHGDFVHAMKRAIRVFSRRTEYEDLRQSAYETTIDVSTVAWAWSSEFHRLRSAIFAQASGIREELELCAQLGNATAFDPSSVPVRFVWNEDGNNVQLFGSFDGWTQKISLNNHPGSNEKFVTLRLPRGSYYFKFNVDGRWVHSSKYEVRHDGQFENNFLEVQ